MKSSFDAPEEIIAAYDKRGKSGGIGRSTAIAQTLALHLELLKRSRVELAKQFSPEECALILDATNGTMLSDPMSVQLLPFGVADAIELDGLDEKWGVDGDALMAKLEATSYVERLTIADCVKLWWVNGSTEYADLFAPDGES